MTLTCFDLGANNGDDTHYLLLKGYDVVTVEANPALCEDMQKRFAAEIAAGRLTLLNAALGWKKERRPFFVNDRASVLSKLMLNPEHDTVEDFREIEVETVTIAELVHDHGLPLYLKSDLEGFDRELLNQMIQLKIRPPLISAEIGSPLTLSQLHVLGYERFYIQNCADVQTRYRNWPVKQVSGETVHYSFPEHSTGPFGEDLRFAYYDIATAMSLMPLHKSAFGLGWYDLHAWIGDKWAAGPASGPPDQ